MSETISPRAGALASLRPQFSVPPAVRGPLLVAIPVLMAVWSLAGLYASLVPALVHSVFGWDASLKGGLALFMLAGSGAAAVLLLRRLQAEAMLALGSAALLAGSAVTVAALAGQSAIGFLAGTVVAGVGFGVGFQGAMRTVIPLARPHERAGVLSVVLVVSYLAMGVPAIVAGFVVVHTHNLAATAEGFGVYVALLTALALAGTRLKNRRAPAIAGG